MSKSFAENIKARRLALGFSLRDVEAILDGHLSNGYLSQLENGKIKNPSVHVVMMLCSAYAVSNEEALAWLGVPFTPPAPRVCDKCGQALPLQYVIDQQEPTP